MKEKLSFLWILGILFLLSDSSVFSQDITSTSHQWLNHSSGIGTATVHCLASSGNVLYAGTFLSGLFKSTNNGENWINIGFSGNVVNSIAMTSDRIILGTSAGIWYSSDGGTNWINSTLAPFSNDISALLIKGNKIFAGGQDGIFSSTNNGTNWIQSSPMISVISLAANDSCIFAGKNNDGVYKSTDNGVVWTDCFFYNWSIRSLATIDNYIFAGTDGTHGIYVSTDNGSSWSQTLLIGENHSVNALLVVGTDIYASAGPFVFLSTNNGTNWASISNGLPTFGANSIYSLTKSGDYFFAGLYGNGVWRTVILPSTFTVIPQGFYEAGTDLLNMKDIMTVQVRSSSPPYSVSDSAQNVIDSNSFTGRFFFSSAFSGNYYIALKHRNSIETWSSSPITFLSGVASYDFTTDISTAFGNNLNQVNTSPLRFAIYSGDVDQDGVVDGTDGATIDNDAFNFVIGYVVSDITGDNVTDGSDAAIADNNAFNFVTKITP